EVAELRHLRRPQRRTLRVVDANRLVRGIVGNGRANRLRRNRGEAVMDADRDPQRVDQADDRAAARPVSGFDGTARRPDALASALRSSAKGTDSPKPMRRAAGPRLTR